MVKRFLILVPVLQAYGLPSWLSSKESACQCRSYRRCGFNCWVGNIPWRRKWQPTSVFLLGWSHGQRNLAGYSPWDCKESDTTERLRPARGSPSPLGSHFLRTPVDGRLGHGVHTLLPVTVSTRKPGTLTTTLLPAVAPGLWPLHLSITRGGSALRLSCSWAGGQSGGWWGSWSGWTGDWSSGSISLRLPTLSSSSSSSMHDWSMWITYSESSKWNRCQEPTWNNNPQWISTQTDGQVNGSPWNQQLFQGSQLLCTRASLLLAKPESLQRPSPSQHPTPRGPQKVALAQGAQWAESWQGTSTQLLWHGRRATLQRNGCPSQRWRECPSTTHYLAATPGGKRVRGTGAVLRELVGKGQLSGLNPKASGSRKQKDN